MHAAVEVERLAKSYGNHVALRGVSFRVERGESVAERKGRPDLRHADPDKLPSTYRDRIERYFRKLSEQ